MEQKSTKYRRKVVNRHLLIDQALRLRLFSFFIRLIAHVKEMGEHKKVVGWPPGEWLGERGCSYLAQAHGHLVPGRRLINPPIGQKKANRCKHGEKLSKREEHLLNNQAEKKAGCSGARVPDS
jgi:hypothetical protein